MVIKWSSGCGPGGPGLARLRPGNYTNGSDEGDIVGFYADAKSYTDGFVGLP